MTQHRRKADRRPKAGYDTEEQAQATITPAGAAAGQNVYQCTVCHRWHVGHRVGSTFRTQRDAARKRRRKDVH